MLGCLSPERNHAMWCRGILKVDGGSDQVDWGSLTRGEKGNAEVGVGFYRWKSALQLEAEAVVLIPRWQIWKYGDVCTEETRQHFEVLCFLPVRRGLIRGTDMTLIWLWFVPVNKEYTRKRPVRGKAKKHLFYCTYEDYSWKLNSNISLSSLLPLSSIFLKCWCAKIPFPWCVKAICRISNWKTCVKCLCFEK